MSTPTSGWGHRRGTPPPMTPEGTPTPSRASTRFLTAIREDPIYALTHGIAIVFIAACIAITAVLTIPKHLRQDDTPTPTSWPYGDGDRVVITPKTAP